MTNKEAVRILMHLWTKNSLSIAETIAVEKAIKALEAQSIRPTGKWKKYLDEGDFLYCECLNCGHITNESDNYCPNCGSYNGGRG